MEWRTHATWSSSNFIIALNNFQHSFMTKKKKKNTRQTEIRRNLSQNKGNRWIDEECTYIDKHWVVHRVVELLYCTHETWTNVIVYNYCALSLNLVKGIYKKTQQLKLYGIRTWWLPAKIRNKTTMNVLVTLIQYCTDCSRKAK